MPLNDFEREVLRRFRVVVKSALDRDIGRFTEQDARGAASLRIDATFDEAVPALAVEVTTIRDSDHWRTAGSVDKALAGLEEIATRDRLGTFEIAVHGTARLARLAPRLPLVLRDMVRRGQHAFHPAEDDPLRVEGLLFVSWLGTGQDVVRACVMSDADFGAIDEDLRSTISANAVKLGEAGSEGRETHLVTMVEPHRSPEGAAVPELPPEIDYVWLFLQFEPGPKEQNVWWVRRVEGRWHTALSW